MKWIQLPLISMFLFWVALFLNDEHFSSSSTSTQSEWLIRFEEKHFDENTKWPDAIEQMEVHLPVHSIIVRTSLSESELRETLHNLEGIKRIERGYRDALNSPVYPTGYA
ncbi:MAG: hypothetical protein RL040_483, partial [Bacteroidota bacterium]